MKERNESYARMYSERPDAQIDEDEPMPEAPARSSPAPFNISTAGKVTLKPSRSTGVSASPVAGPSRRIVDSDEEEAPESTSKTR